MEISEHEIEAIRCLKKEYTSPEPFSGRPPKPIRKFLLSFFRPKDPLLLSLLEGMVEHHNQDESDRLADWEKMNSIPEVAFVLTVLVPCWFEYREPVVYLLQRARHGEMEALEKILWLDKNAIHDPRIAKEWHLASQRPDGVRFHKLAKALHSQSRTKLTSTKVKIWMSGLILLLSEGLQHKLSTPEIRRLFDALAYDLLGHYYDEDIDLDEGAFRMAVTRERDFWKPFVREVLKFISYKPL